MFDLKCDQKVCLAQSGGKVEGGDKKVAIQNATRGNLEVDNYINTQIHKYKSTNTNTQIHKYRNTNTQIQIHNYNYTNTITQITMFKPPISPCCTLLKASL